MGVCFEVGAVEEAESIRLTCPGWSLAGIPWDLGASPAAGVTGGVLLCGPCTLPATLLQLSPPSPAEPVFWFHVKELLSKHELQRFAALHHIASDVGRGRAWLRCALNEHSLERYLHMLLADRGRLRYPCLEGIGWG